MSLAFLLVIASTHVAFAGVFGFMVWQKRSRFAGALAIAWILQAARVVPLIRQQYGASVPTNEWALADVLFPAAMWCLVLAGFDLIRRPVSNWWGGVYVVVSGLFALAANYVGTALIMRVAALPLERAVFWAVFVRQLGVFVPGGVILLGLAVTLYRHWRVSRLPGALIGAIFALPYAVGVVIVPLQWYWSVYSVWGHFAWFLQILGLSTGFLILVLNQEHAVLMETLQNLRRLRGLLPICAACKRIRDDAGYWSEIETYIRDHSEAEFSHGLCPRCAASLYPELGSAEQAEPRA
jgi:ABC-type sugar transport system permease subunit